jgi:hypothetical protein
MNCARCRAGKDPNALGESHDFLAKEFQDLHTRYIFLAYAGTSCARYGVFTPCHTRAFAADRDLVRITLSPMKNPGSQDECHLAGPFQGVTGCFSKSVGLTHPALTFSPRMNSS